MKGIYLDNSMTTQPSEKAISQMLSFYTSYWGSPQSPHQFGQGTLLHIQDALAKVYRLIGATEEDTVVCTSSGSEAVNHAVFSTYYDMVRTTGKNHILACQTDEAPALLSISRLEKMGCVPKFISPNCHGILTAEAVAESISPRTAMLSLSWANGLTGVIQPVAEISKICQERGIRLHLEATHVLGKLYYELSEINPHFLSFNGDHIHSPQGTGALFIKQGINISPLIAGGMEQTGLRAGAWNVAGIVALGYAADEALDARDYVGTEIARLRDLFEKGVQDLFPNAVLFFRGQERLPHVACIGFPGISNEAMLFQLNRKNLYASIGGGSFQQIGLILTACGIPSSLANTAISFSLSRTTTEEEVERAIEIVADTAKQMARVVIKPEEKNS